MKRKIIKIDEEKCNGCGVCIPNCPEGALQIIDGKARLVSDLFCDGLGACIGHCPQGAITIEDRDAGPYDEKKVMENIAKQGENTIRAYLEHLKSHGEEKYLKQAIEFLKERNIANPLQEEAGAGYHHAHAMGGCPCSQMMDFRKKQTSGVKVGPASRQESQLRQWPVQLKLVPNSAPYFQDTDLVIAADCVPFAYANFHEDFLKDKALVIACPKLDDVDFYRQKLAQIFKDGKIRAIKILHMEVPCCYGLNALVEEAFKLSKQKIPVEEVVISITGEIKSSR